MDQDEDNPKTSQHF